MSKFKVQSSNEIQNPPHSFLLPSGERAGVRGGFTLIEVVVAVAILGIALTIIIELFAGGLRLARASKEYTKAVNYANAKMEEINSRQTLEEGITEGEFDETFHWRVTVNKVNLLPENLPPEDKPSEVKPPIQLFQVKVDVLWKPGSKERSASVETYRALKVQDEEKKS
jgi:general secretion pathway protein I